jgi:orotidine-5'-phosphate decarboxylase
MLNVHASGGADMMRAARAAADDEAAGRDMQPPLVIAVTVLTSMDHRSLGEAGVTAPVNEQVRRLALLAQSAALDGVVASPHEIATIREACDPRFAIVTPGIRGAADPKDDQQRTATAAAALAAGASYLVVGRPIIGAADPRDAAEQIAAGCRADAGR